MEGMVVFFSRERAKLIQVTFVGKSRRFWG